MTIVQSGISTIRGIFSFLSGATPTGPSDDDGEFQTPATTGSRRPATRSQSPRETKKRKTTDGTDDGGSLSIEQIAASLRTYQSKVDERQKRADDRERKSDIRAQRIESLLKRVLENQKQLLSADSESDEEEEEEEEETEAKSPGNRWNGASSGRRPWSEQERDLVSMGLALYGKDYRAIAGILEGRNRNQISGFLKRNRDLLGRARKQYPSKTEKQKEALMEMIERRQEGEEEDEFEEDDDEEEEVEAEGEAVEVDDDEDDDGEVDVMVPKKRANKGAWTDEEQEQLFKGIEVHGKADFKALSSYVKTRSPQQTRMYIYRRLQSKKAQN